MSPNLQNPPAVERRHGRPRSERARSSVLATARRLLARDGLGQLTIEAISADAGVSKATIYRWWPGKTAVVLESVLEQVEQDVPFPDSGDLRADLEAEIGSVITLYTRTDTGSAMLDLVAASRTDPALATALRERFFTPRRAAATTWLRRGVERGVLRSDLDLEIVIDAVWGALYYRLLVAHLPLEPGYAHALVDQVWPLLAATRATGAAPPPERTS